MLTGVLIGLAIAFIPIVLFVLFAIKYHNRFRNLDQKKLINWLNRFLLSGKNFETLNFDDLSDVKFAQFKKYIVSETDYGIDFVLPLVGEYKNARAKVMEVCEKLSLELRFIPSEHGWDFAFVEVTRDGEIISTAVEAMLSISELDFENDVGLAQNTSFEWRRKDVILGSQVLGIDDPQRYDVLPEA